MRVVAVDLIDEYEQMLVDVQLSKERTSLFHQIVVELSVPALKSREFYPNSTVSKSLTLFTLQVWSSVLMWWPGLSDNFGVG